MKQDYAEAMGVEQDTLTNDYLDYPEEFLRPTAKVGASNWAGCGLPHCAHTRSAWVRVCDISQIIFS